MFLSPAQERMTAFDPTAIPIGIAYRLRGGLFADGDGMSVVGGMHRAIIGARFSTVASGAVVDGAKADAGAVSSDGFAASRAGKRDRKSIRSARKTHVRRPALTARNSPLASHEIQLRMRGRDDDQHILERICQRFEVYDVSSRSHSVRSQRRPKRLRGRKGKHSFEARGFGEVGHSNGKRTARIPTLQPLSGTPAALVFGSRDRSTEGGIFAIA